MRSLALAIVALILAMGSVVACFWHNPGASLSLSGATFFVLFLRSMTQ